MSFVRVSNHAIFPSKSQVSAKRREFQEKCKNYGPFRSKALCGTTFPPFPAFGLKSARDGALTVVTVRVRTFGHFASGRVPYKSWFGGSLAWLNPLFHSQEAQILTQIHCVLLFSWAHSCLPRVCNFKVFEMAHA